MKKFRLKRTRGTARSVYKTSPPQNVTQKSFDARVGEIKSCVHPAQQLMQTIPEIRRYGGITLSWNSLPVAGSGPGAVGNGRHRERDRESRKSMNASEAMRRYVRLKWSVPYKELWGLKQFCDRRWILPFDLPQGS